jgi:hypothetical protein
VANTPVETARILAMELIYERGRWTHSSISCSQLLLWIAEMERLDYTI